MQRFIVLNEDERSALFAQNPASARDGGFQSVMVRLQQQYRPGSQELRLTDDDIEAIQRYAFDFKQGGWQTRLLAIFERNLGALSGKILSWFASSRT